MPTVASHSGSYAAAAAAALTSAGVVIMLVVEPQVRYAKTSDGVNIAWFAIGSGEPYVWSLSPPGAGLIDGWHNPEVRPIYEFVARGSRLVVCDPRGFGLSDRDVTDFSCDAVVRDFEAVVAAAELGPVTLQTDSIMSVPAVRFAARHPDRVRALVMWNGIMRGSDLSDNWKRLHRLAAEDWDYAKGVLSRGNNLMLSTATFEKVYEQITRGAAQEAFVAFGDAVAGWDAADVADRVETPALVTHTQPAHFTPLEASRALAITLPNGRFTPITESDPAARRDALTRAIVGFVRDILPRPPRGETPETQASSGTAIILFTDIVDSTALTERHGDSAFRTSSRALDDAIRTAMRERGGSPVDGKVLGDGVLGVFQSAARAIDCASACLAAAAVAGLELHIGLHAGDVIHEGGTVYGGAVNIASRVCGLSQPGEILLSSTVRDLARTSAAVDFDDRGEHSLKGVAEPVRVFAVSRGLRD